MKCTSCNEETRVLDSRQAPDNVFRRRRECLVCKKRFTTYESTIAPGVVINHRKAQAQRKKRYYHVNAESIKFKKKRWYMRATAREQAKKTGENLQALYKQWGVD